MEDLHVTPGELPALPTNVYETYADGADGLRSLDSMLDAAAALARGDWIEGSVSIAQTGLEVASYVVDPVGELAGMAAEWALAHCQPFQEMLAELLGDATAVCAAAATWRNIGGCLAGVAPSYDRQVGRDLGSSSGVTVIAYRTAAHAAQAYVSGLGRAADYVAEGILLAGSVLGAVRSFVQTRFADAIAMVSAAFIKSACTAGVLAPAAGIQLAANVAQLIGQCRDLMRDLRACLRVMADLVGAVSRGMGGGARMLRELFERGPVSPGLELVVETGVQRGDAHHL